MNPFFATCLVHWRSIMWGSTGESLRNSIVASVAMACILGGCSSESSDWESVQKKGTPDALREFVQRYPSGQFRQAATDKLDDLEYEQAKSKGTVAALESFIADHKSSRHLQKAQQRRDVALQSKAYRWSPDDPILGKVPSRDFEVSEPEKGRREFVATSNNASFGMVMSLDGKVLRSYMEGLGSERVRLRPNKDFGYVTYAGLRFEAEAIVAIGQDGIVSVDREGIRASDQHGKQFLSRTVEIDGQPITIMIHLY